MDLNEVLAQLEDLLERAKELGAGKEEIEDMVEGVFP